MKTSENSLSAFFDSYARANDQNNLMVIADFYSDHFIAGGPNGNAVFKNDETFIQWLQQLQKFNRVVPNILGELMSHPENGQRVAQAFMKMKKFDIEGLKNA